MKLNFALLVLCIVCSQVNCQMCGNATTCEGCYEIPDCAWCSDSNIDISLRCFPINSTNSTVTCGSIENRESSVELEERALTFDNQVSISKATLRLRAGNSRTFRFDVRAAENFPLDLYMIVDLSNSLRDDLDNIKNVSSDIADTIRNISTRFQVGLGTYVDKLVEPYVGRAALLQALSAGGEKSSCLNTPCIRPISYVHNINLTNSSAEFTNGTSTLEISTNADNPEGTFDAMAQSVLCKDVVGWRDNSRKILIVITDAVIHMAGDGILAGIGLRAPMECKTRYDPEQDVYTYVDNLKFDYPSIEQIRILFEENLVSPVFALSGDVEDFYDRLADQLASTNPQVVRIAADSRDIIQAIQSAYENIVSNVSLSFDVGTEAISISTSVTCPEEAIKNDDGVSCSDVTTNQTVNFEVTVTLKSCTDEQGKNSSRVINVNIPGYGQFVIEVAGICSCDCEKTAVMNSPDCSGQGSLTCGICMCNMGWIGDTCNCESSVTIPCQAGPNGEECSGSSRGECLCGDCVCNSPVARKSQDNNQFYEFQNEGVTKLLIEPPRIYGDTCECDNFRCDRNAAGVVCSGEQGNCTCDGVCTCHSAGYGDILYSGDACECNEALCYNTSIPFTSNMMKCNGNGMCQPCNQPPCNCEPGFLPPFCTPGPSLIQDPQCFPSGSMERNCVECIAENSDYNSSCSSCLISLSHNYTRLEDSDYEIPDSVNGTETTRCTFDTLDPICTYVYFLSIRADSDAPNGLQLRVEVEPLSECFPLRFWQIALILLGGLIILGIIILAIVKIIFMVLDYIEVKNLDKSVAETDLSKNLNPLYQSPEVTYKNINFGKE